MSSCVSPVSLEKCNVTAQQPTTTNNNNGFSADKLVVASAAFNSDFLKSSAGRTMRLLAEFEEYPKRMERLGVRGSFLFFGSARSKYLHQYTYQLSELELQLAELQKAGGGGGGVALNAAEADAKQQKDIDSVKSKIETLKTLEWTAEYMEKTEELAKKLTEWAMSAEGRDAGM